jgi:aminoglycoside phosphotransferase (APT) family kinase protein
VIPSPPAEVRRLVEGVLGAADEWEPAGAGGYTGAEKWFVRAAGRRAFVKAAADSAQLDALRNECAVLFSLASPHLPVAYGAHVDGEDVGVLVLEDLSGAAWPPPWPDDLDELSGQVRSLHAQAVPERLKPYGTPTLGRWAAVEQAADDVVALGLLDGAWLARHLPALLEAEAGVALEGTELVHGDLGAPNLCFVPGRGAVAVDWADAGAGNGAWDLVVLGIDVRYSTGGRRRLDVPDAAGWTAFQAGSFALQAASPPPEWAPDGAALRAVQRELARVALLWACEELGLPPPAGS